LLYAANWSSGLGAWSSSGQWQIENGALISECSYNCTILAPYHPPTANYVVDAKVSIVGVNGGFFGIVTRVLGSAPQASGYIGGLAGLSESGGSVSGVAEINFINSSVQMPSVPITTRLFALHDYRLKLQGEQLTLYVDGVVMGALQDSSFQTPGQLGLRASPGAQIRVISLTVSAA
jgi:hypothetical protein